MLTFALAPVNLFDLLRGLANLWSLGLVLAVAVTLVWFVYSLFLRRLWRARRIANLRLKRILKENEASDPKP